MNFLCTNNISDKSVIVHNLSVNAPSFSTTLGIFRHRKVGIPKFLLPVEPPLLNSQCFAKRKTLLQIHVR